MSEIAELYPILNERAYEIVLNYTGLPYDFYKDMAHDITVDFLFFSKSFKRTFEEIRGSLLPFFSSYVRKKAFSIWLRKKKHFNKISLKNEEDLMKAKCLETPVEEWVELTQRLSHFQAYLNDYFYLNINLGRLFRLCFISLLEVGEVSKPLIAPRLLCTKNQVKSALVKMRLLLKKELAEGF